MGCCVPVEGEMIIKSNIPFTDKELFENENKNIFQKDSNTHLVIVKPEKQIYKTLDLVNKIENVKIEQKHRKSMNILKEISYKEVCNSTKYF